MGIRSRVPRLVPGVVGVTSRQEGVMEWPIPRLWAALMLPEATFMMDPRASAPVLVMSPATLPTGCPADTRAQHL